MSKVEKEERELILEKLELKDALNLRSVRNVFWRLIAKANFFATTGSMSLEDANYRAGMRDLVAMVIHELEEANQPAWIEMQNDAKEESDE